MRIKYLLGKLALKVSRYLLHGRKPKKFSRTLTFSVLFWRTIDNLILSVLKVNNRNMKIGQSKVSLSLARYAPWQTNARNECFNNSVAVNALLGAL